MQYIIKNLLASETFLTVISGVFVFIFSQLLNEYWIKPIQEYKKLRAKVSHNLTLYANLYSNPVEYKNINKSIKSASYELRKLASEIQSTIELKPRFCFLFPSKDRLFKSSENMIRLSNNLCSPYTNIAIQQNIQTVKNICSSLKIKQNDL